MPRSSAMPDNSWARRSQKAYHSDTMYMGGQTGFDTGSIPKDKRCRHTRRPLLLLAAGAVLLLLLLLLLFGTEGKWQQQYRKAVCRRMQFLDPSGRCEVLLHPRPHIIFVLGSEIGHGDVDFSCQQAAVGLRTHCPTPFLASLAEAGLILSNYYGHQTSIPSRAAFLTGRYASHTGLGGGAAAVLPRGYLTIADQLKVCT